MPKRIVNLKRESVFEICFGMGTIICTGIQYHAHQTISRGEILLSVFGTAKKELEE
jgi:hypothetical protein